MYSLHIAGKPITHILIEQEGMDFILMDKSEVKAFIDTKTATNSETLDDVSISTITGGFQSSVEQMARLKPRIVPTNNHGLIFMSYQPLKFGDTWIAEASFRIRGDVAPRSRFF
jgi:hypothetical protein